MKKYLVGLLVIVVAGLGQNLLQNPGFEQWTAGMPDFWYKDDSILVFQEDGIVHSGNFSVRESLITQTQDRADFLQGPFAIAPNQEYTFSIWVYDNDPAGRLRQSISWHTGAGWTTSYSPVYSVDSPNWQALTFTALPPPGSDSAIVFVRAYDIAANWDGNAIFYLDDASFTAPAMQAPVIVRIWHKPTNPATGEVVNVYAYVTDDGTILADTLYYGINDLNTPIGISHTTVNNDTFHFSIPGQSAGDTIFYFLKVIDNDGLVATSETSAYFVGAMKIYINEVYYDAPDVDSGCFIELFGPPGANLNGISLVGINGANGSEYTTIDLAGYSIGGDGFFVIGQNPWIANVDTVTTAANLQNGPDNLELRFNNITIDALGYGTLDGWVFTGEWLPAVDVAAGRCLCRYPDGDDTDNNFVDFVACDSLTPGEPNPDFGIAERNGAPIPKILIQNPVNSKGRWALIINNRGLYPVKIYNSLGQLVKTVHHPETLLNLPGGIYFLKLSGVNNQPVKIVVVK